MPRGASPERAPTGERLLRALPVALVVLVGLASYANSFGVPFQFDDKVVLIGEPAITGFNPDPASRRFLGDLSFAISYRLFGERPAGYHAVNLAIHLAAALLLHALLRTLWRTDRLRAAPDDPAPGRIALLGALLFVAHPIQTQAVTYIVQRYASLAAALVLLSCLAYLRFRLQPPGARAAGWYAAFLVSGAAACWTKENALVLPLLIAALEWTFFDAPLRRRALVLSPFIAAGLLAAGWLALYGPPLARLDALTRVDTAMPRGDYLLTQLRVVATYLRLLVLPVGQNLDHDFAVSRSLADPGVLPSLALHLLLLGGAAAAIARGGREPRLRLAGFGILWFYVALLVESSVLPIVDVIYEHRVYLPSAGIFAAMAAGLSAVPALAPRPRWNAVVAAAAILLAGLTLARNRVWRDEHSLWSDAAAKSPNKARPQNNLGIALFERGDLLQAARSFERAIRVDPTYTKAYFNLGETRQKLGDCAGAVAPYELFLRVHPRYPDTYRNLADCYERLGRSAEAQSLRATLSALLREQRGALPAYYR